MWRIIIDGFHCENLKEALQKCMHSAITPCVIKPVATYAVATDLTSSLRRQARENFLQINIRIMTIQPSSLDQTNDCRRPFSTA
uniref:Uncharacterized protein n=1 Tax=Pseudomonas syringae TaxID=317 RepID=I3W0E3_PSESX|nr:hypothetical protein [Pseudomonas syringae]